ncbi:hypothetical protein SAMN05660284_02436 [Formivibrio citricus]|uniref:Uncharacterized protein n=1 Tax=Formivibrio citricus TaxID=83765 RepID=A0A1I5CM32_9NEIS|nr:hypothetical protein SAMN05660284_02436 [Formivibrio citricus]
MLHAALFKKNAAHLAQVNGITFVMELVHEKASYSLNSPASFFGTATFFSRT